MALQDMSAADLAAVVNDNDGFGGGNMAWWIIILFLFSGWGGGWGGNAASNEVYPLLENQQNLFNGFGGLQAAVTAGFANAETAATARQMADMQQSFSLSQQLSQCCCENRLATANLQADIARENCADRQAIADGIQAILVKLDQQDLFAERRENDNLRQQINMLQLAASQTAQTAQLIAELKPASTTA